MQRPKSETHGAWQIAPATVDARIGLEKLELQYLKQLFAACDASSDPKVREAVTRVRCYESVCRYMGAQGMLSEVLTGEVK